MIGFRMFKEVANLPVSQVVVELIDLMTMFDVKESDCGSDPCLIECNCIQFIIYLKSDQILISLVDKNEITGFCCFSIAFGKELYFK